MNERVFIYWDNSGILHEAQRIAEARSQGPDARYRVRIHFAHLLRLAQADRKLGRMFTVGPMSPEMRLLWNRMENAGVEVSGVFDWGEQKFYNQTLQVAMLEDLADNPNSPGTIALLTGDGDGYYPDSGFHRNLERMHKHGWKVEILSWVHICNRHLREWAEENGVFVALDDFYDSITFMMDSYGPGHPIAEPRSAAPLDLAQRKVA